jgi:hypothetical protein
MRHDAPVGRNRTVPQSLTRWPAAPHARLLMLAAVVCPMRRVRGMPRSTRRPAGPQRPPRARVRTRETVVRIRVPVSLAVGGRIRVRPRRVAASRPAGDRETSPRVVDPASGRTGPSGGDHLSCLSRPAVGRRGGRPLDWQPGQLTQTDQLAVRDTIAPAARHHSRGSRRGAGDGGRKP